MEKVKEKVDWLKKVLEIDIDSPIFNCMRQDLNREIQRVIEKVYEGEFEGGEVTLKLNLTIPESYKEFPKENEFGEMVSEMYMYRRPNFEHKVTTNLKKQYKQEGCYFEEKEVKFQDGQYIVAPIEDPQTTIEDFLA